jgi:hypothetical protein
MEMDSVLMNVPHKNGLLTGHVGIYPTTQRIYSFIWFEAGQSDNDLYNVAKKLRAYEGFSLHIVQYCQPSLRVLFFLLNGASCLQERYVTVKSFFFVNWAINQ